MAYRSTATTLLVMGAAFCMLSGCSDDAPPVTQNFAPLQYDYLSKIRLNTGSIDVQDHSQPVGPQDVAGSSPVAPAQAMARMARDRLFAAGTSGQAVFVIDQASIVRAPGGTLDGHLAAHLDLLSPGGVREGFADAQVSRQSVPGSEPENGPAALYSLTRRMMDDMNVEIEYQIKRTLQAYLVAPGSVPAPVAAQPLGVPGSPPPVPAPPALPPAATDAAPLQAGAYQDPADEPQAPQMSPPPGFLQVPAGQN